MRYITQFSPGNWWSSQDGRQWRKLQGPVARQLMMGFELIQGALGFIAEPDETFDLQAQFVCMPENSVPRAMRQAMHKAVIDADPISDREIEIFANSLNNSQVFKEPPKNTAS